MVSIFKIYKFLRYKDRFVRGNWLCKHLNIPFKALAGMETERGIGSFGRARRKSPKNPQQYLHVVKHNSWCADFWCTFKSGGRIYCLKERPTRKGKYPPIRNLKLIIGG